METIGGHGNAVQQQNVQILVEEGHAIREFLVSSRSDGLLRLFDFLLEQSQEGFRPREADIVAQIFPASVGLGHRGSQVRVLVHRLRKKIDIYYEGKTGRRLVIPSGEYCLVVANGSTSEVTDAGVPTKAPRAKLFWSLLCVILLANLFLGWLYFSAPLKHEVARVESPWKLFEESKKPTLLAVGDYFMFVRKSDEGSLETVQDLSIDTADVFYNYLSETGNDRQKQLSNADLYTISSDLLPAIGGLWQRINALNPSIVASSSIDPEMMRSSNIIFVGALDSLSPLLGGPLFQTSSFDCGKTCYELVDRTTNQKFQSDSPYLLGDNIIPRRDYGYIASYPGPSGNQILVVSGTGDAGVSHMVEVLNDPKKVKELTSKISGFEKSFEALYQVRIMFNQGYDSSIVAARPISTDKMWDTTEKRRWRSAR